MLIGLNPILGPDLLYALRSMGHGDEIAIVDGNYPADSHSKNLLRVDGLGLVPVLDAILSVIPLDIEAQSPVMRTCNYNTPDVPDQIHLDIDETIHMRYPNLTIPTNDGSLIYDRIKQCHTIVATTEQALFANVVIKKGVVRLL